MQVCTLLQTDKHASTPPLSFLQAGCPSCRPTNSVKALKALKALKAQHNCVCTQQYTNPSIVAFLFFLFTNTSEHIHFLPVTFFLFFPHFLVVGSTETRTRSVEPVNLLITNMGRLILPLAAVVSRGPSAKTARHNKRGNLHNMAGAYKPSVL